MATDADKVAQDDERFLRAYPAAVSAGRWEDVARLLSGKCRALEKKAAAANKANAALVAALSLVRSMRTVDGLAPAVHEFEHEKRREAWAKIDSEIDAALALARSNQ